MAETTNPTNPELVERVARALYEHWVHESVEDDWVGWERLRDKETWRERATAAIEAMPSSNEARLQETLEWVSAEIERYGVTLTPELSIVCRWLTDHFRCPETIDAALTDLSNEGNG